MSNDIDHAAIMYGIIEDHKKLVRDAGTAVSTINRVVGELSEMSPYMITKASEPDSFITPTFIGKNAAKLVAELDKLKGDLAIVQKLEDLIDPDPAVVAAALVFFNDLNSGKAPFESRYD